MARPSSTVLRMRTGLVFEIVGRETEAKLAVSGCASLLDRSLRLGAGVRHRRRQFRVDLARSSQNRAGTGGAPCMSRVGMQNAIAAWTSLPLGVVNLAERHGGRDVTIENYEAMVEDVGPPWPASNPSTGSASAWRPTVRISSARPARSRPFPAFTWGCPVTIARGWMDVGSEPQTCAGSRTISSP